MYTDKKEVTTYYVSDSWLTNKVMYGRVLTGPVMFKWGWLSVMEQCSRTSNVMKVMIQCLPEFKTENLEKIVGQISNVTESEIQGSELIYKLYQNSQAEFR